VQPERTTTHLGFDPGRYVNGPRKVHRFPARRDPAWFLSAARSPALRTWQTSSRVNWSIAVITSSGDSRRQKGQATPTAAAPNASASSASMPVRSLPLAIRGNPVRLFGPSGGLSRRIPVTPCQPATTQVPDGTDPPYTVPPAPATSIPATPASASDRGLLTDAPADLLTTRGTANSRTPARSSLATGPVPPHRPACLPQGIQMQDEGVRPTISTATQCSTS
jgi:hypothetical protein